VSKRKTVAKVQCAKCPSMEGAGKMGLCPTCRLRFYRVILYPWTPAMDDRLRMAYRSHSKKELSAKMTELQRLYRYPRHILQNRAQTLGLSAVEMNPWTDEQIAYVEENAGSISLTKMAAHLRRTPSSLKNFMHRKGLLSACQEGYSANELRTVLGVSHSQIEAWQRRGLLQRSEDLAGRITHESVRRFCLHNMEEFSLRRVDERWLKMMIREEIEQGWNAGRKSMQAVGIDQAQRRWA
jgi:hypothetical protein